MDGFKTASLVLGIDTGGTYTDAVALDFHQRAVVSSAKSLTTPSDLTTGIEQAVAQLALPDPKAVRLVCISTTLATNSIVEGRRGRVALALIGYDPAMIASFGLSDRFATKVFRFFRGGHDINGDELAPLDLGGILKWAEGVAPGVDALAVSSYFSPLNPEHEESVLDAVRRNFDIPVVLGHQLANRLDSVQRATTAALNASLLRIVSTFISATSKALQRHAIDAPIMVVKGDGSLMSVETAMRRPVETILSGPAASAMGGRYLSGLDNALVIDVGGTTTDIVLIENGQVDLAEDGATVGGFRTAVRAADMRSIGLGGDSRVWFDRDRELHVGPERVVPICYLASEYPQVEKEILQLREKSLLDVTSYDLMYLSSMCDPASAPGDLSPTQKRVLELTAESPMSVSRLMKKVGVVHPLQMGIDKLRRRGLVSESGLTPTDLMHVTGQFERWSMEAARTGAAMLSRINEREESKFVEDSFALIRDIICREVTAYLARRSGTRLPLQIADDYGLWFMSNSLDGGNRFVSTTVKLEIPIIGIGAPARAFLEPVGHGLRSSLVLPDHYSVANAAGTVAGGVVSTVEARVYPHNVDHGALEYLLQVADERQRFGTLEGAISHGKQIAAVYALREAQSNGATEPQVTTEVRPDGFDTFTIRSMAAGGPKLIADV